MIRDYDKYELKGKELLTFMVFGYLAIGLIGYIFYKNIILSLCAGCCVVFLKKYYQNAKAGARKELLLKQFQDLLYSLAGSIATGRNMQSALREGSRYLRTIYSEDSPLVVELDRMIRAVDEKNEDEAEQLDQLGKRSKCRDIADFALVYAMSRSTGSDMEKVIQRAANIISDKMQIEAEIRALTAQKKTESRIIAIMPVIVIVCLNIVSPDYIAVLYETIAGRLIMTICLGGMALAYHMIEKITRIEV